MLFDEISKFWDEIADANSTERQTVFVMKNIERGSILLDLCCGSGRHSVQLSKKGYVVVGLDISNRLLRIAKSKASEAKLDLQLVRADMRFVPFKSEAFNGIISLDASFGYLPSYSEDIQSLNEVCRILKNKSVFLIDIFNRHRLEQRYKKRFIFSYCRNIFLAFLRIPGGFRLFKWKEYSSFSLLQRKEVTAEGNLFETWFFRDKKTKQISSYEHVMRLYNISQLKTMFEKTCLRITEIYGNYDAQKYSENSPRLIEIAEKA
jgi:ubiquinone/menaquinone biosynthesis C-methylase UbiE